MPSFSLPHSSHVCADVEAYLAARYHGTTRKQAAQGSSLATFGYLTLKRLDQRLQDRALILKACEPCPERDHLAGYPFLLSLAASDEPVSVVNQRYLVTQGRGWLFGNLAWLCRHDSAGRRISHDVSSVQPLWCTAPFR